MNFEILHKTTKPYMEIIQGYENLDSNALGKRIVKLKNEIRSYLGYSTMHEIVFYLSYLKPKCRDVGINYDEYISGKKIYGFVLDKFEKRDRNTGITFEMWVNDGWKLSYQTFLETELQNMIDRKNQLVEETKESTKSKSKEKVTCGCGGCNTLSNKMTHEKTKRHLSHCAA